MFVLLIQPPVAFPSATARLADDPPAPPWELVGLHAYLQNRTGHQVALFDARLQADWRRALENMLPADVRQVAAVVYARAEALPGTVETLAFLAGTAAEALRVLCGPVASALPEAALALPGVQVLLAGDPEPLLRIVLENRSQQSLLRGRPGIAVAGADAPAPAAWLPDLLSLPTPAWDALPFRTYAQAAQGGIRISWRISRGHPGTPADRAWGGAAEPLRFFDLPRCAAAFGRCAHVSVVETQVVDPPGIWTPERLQAWCEALITARNSHPWSLQLPLRLLSAEEIETLREAGCRRLELFLPSSRPGEWPGYGIHSELRLLAKNLLAIRQGGLHLRVHAWVGGPGEDRMERSRWLRLFHHLGEPPFQPRPFPFEPDAPMWNADPAAARQPPDLRGQVEAAAAGKPIAESWSGVAAQARAEKICARLSSDISQGWPLRLRRLLHLLARAIE